MSEFEVAGYFRRGVFLRGGVRGGGWRQCELLGQTKCCKALEGIGGRWVALWKANNCDVVDRGGAIQANNFGERER
jgi:hypothetical protein